MATFPGSNPFYGMDDLSAALAVQLLLEDSEQLRINSKGKFRELEVSDAELALAYFEEELGKVSVIIADRLMTQSIGVAVQTDGNVLTELLSQEQEAGSDRDVALRLGGKTVPPRKPWIVSSAEMDEELLAKLSARYVSSPAANDESGGPVSADSEGESGVLPLLALAEHIGTQKNGAVQHVKNIRIFQESTCPVWTRVLRRLSKKPIRELYDRRIAVPSALLQTIYTNWRCAYLLDI